MTSATIRSCTRFTSASVRVRSGAWNVRLQAKVAGLEAKLGAAEADRTELAGLRQERKEVLAQVDGIIKELDRLDIQ